MFAGKTTQLIDCIARLPVSCTLSVQETTAAQCELLAISCHSFLNWTDILSCKPGSQGNASVGHHCSSAQAGTKFAAVKSDKDVRYGASREFVPSSQQPNGWLFTHDGRRQVKLALQELYCCAC